MRPRTRINRFGRAVDERGRRVTDRSPTPDTCDICGRPMTVGVRTRRGMAHRGCAEVEQ